MKASEYYPKDRNCDVSYLERDGFRIGWLCAKFEAELNALHEAEIDVEVDIDQIIARNLDRDKLMVFIQIFGGKWDKKVEDFYPDKIRYEQEIAIPENFRTGFKIIAAQVPPPPSCRIVEEEVLVPARVEKRKRIVCPKEEVLVPDSTAESSSVEVQPPTTLELSGNSLTIPIDPVTSDLIVKDKETF